MTTRDDIVEAARSWLGTKFHHQGRVKNGGCDCIGLIAGVAKELGIESNILDQKTGNKIALHKFDYANYPKHPDGNFLKEQLDKYLIPIPEETLQKADVVLFKFENSPQHVGIVTDYKNAGLGIIHCYAIAKKVVEHRLDNSWTKRIVATYSFPNISD